jgi:hypothetical protein
MMSRTYAFLLACVLSVTLAGCPGGNGSAPAAVPTSSRPAPSGTPTPTLVASNRAPTITGTASIKATVNKAYSFQPSASDPDGNKLTFQVANKPAWATFDTTTGRLSGTPSSAYTGTFANIKISVSDGSLTATLPAFSIAVASTQLGSATLRWTPPTQNKDGSALRNLAGYVVRYGNSLTALTKLVKIANPGIATYVVDGLSPGKWYFTVAAYNSLGVESAQSNAVSKTV